MRSPAHRESQAEVGGHVEEARGNSPKQVLTVDPDRALV